MAIDANGNNVVITINTTSTTASTTEILNAIGNAITFADDVTGEIIVGAGTYTGYQTYTGSTTSGTATNTLYTSPIIYTEPLTITDEQLTREREQQEQRQRLAEANRIKAERERREAIARAETLLKQSLTPIQLLQLKRFGYFFVKGNQTGRRYRIRHGRSMNIDVMEGRNISHRLCAHPRERCPDEDTMLVQKIMLEHCEQEFLAKAIRH